MIVDRNREKSNFSYYVLNKPYGVLCQFSDSDGRETLASYGPFPKDVYPAGRLDADSEGLVLLTNDGMLKHFLMEPKYRHPRTYLVQVERIPDETALAKLRSGILIEERKTLPAEVIFLKSDPELPPRPVPVRFRKNVPTSWIQLTLREGRNRQVRKMTAAVGYPTLRLIRTAIGNITLGKLLPGEYRKLSAEEMNTLQDKLQVEEF